MFTGIVETTGSVNSISRKGVAYRLEIKLQAAFCDVKIGSSIAVNGACLTVVKNESKSLYFDVMKETFEKTSFRYLKPGDIVNIERSLKADSRIDGHFVLGHVDSIRKIKFFNKSHNPYIDISATREDKGCLVKKGSVAIDGISLTIGELFDDRFRAYIIPHTIEHTNLRRKKAGDFVNIEFDILGKYAKVSFDLRRHMW